MVQNSPLPLVFIPARGGSKSIKKKNLVDLAGKPLIDYCIQAVLSAEVSSQIVCSSDSTEIINRAEQLGIDIDKRPIEFCGDDIKVSEVVGEFLTRKGVVNEWVILVQPTSPFLLPQHIISLYNAARDAVGIITAQNLVKVPHNFHAWSQRSFKEGRVVFLNKEQRAAAYNKQRKPDLYKFGNLVMARCSHIAAGGDFFDEESMGELISSPYDFDVDGPDDLPYAETLISTGLVSLPHMESTSVFGR